MLTAFSCEIRFLPEWTEIYGGAERKFNYRSSRCSILSSGPEIQLKTVRRASHLWGGLLGRVDGPRAGFPRGGRFQEKRQPPVSPGLERLHPAPPGSSPPPHWIQLPAGTRHHTAETPSHSRNSRNNTYLAKVGPSAEVSEVQKSNTLTFTSESDTLIWLHPLLKLIYIIFILLNFLLNFLFLSNNS